MFKGKAMATLFLVRDRRLNLQKEDLAQTRDVCTPAMKKRRRRRMKPIKKSSRMREPLRVTQPPMTAAAPDLCCSTQRTKKNLSYSSTRHRIPAQSQRHDHPLPSTNQLRAPSLRIIPSMYTSQQKGQMSPQMFSQKHPFTLRKKKRPTCLPALRFHAPPLQLRSTSTYSLRLPSEKEKRLQELSSHILMRLEFTL